MPKLDIIIPHWKEDEWLMAPMFKILRMQRNVKFSDFRVLIVLDGEDIQLSDRFKQFVADFPFRTEWFNVEHNGISAARNAGLDHSTADWVIFCDSDDAFLCTTSLQSYFGVMDKNKAMIASAFLEEGWDKRNKRMLLLHHDGHDSIFVHGKVFNRKWLKANKVRFNDDVKLHEDSYFISLAKYVMKDTDAVYIDEPLYLWQFNKNSVTRLYDNFVLRTYDLLCKKNSAIVEEFLRRGMFVPAKGVVCRTITDAYCWLHSKSWNKEGNEELIRDAEDCVSLFLKKYYYIFKSANDIVINTGLNQLKAELIQYNDFDEGSVIPFKDWLDKLRK